VFRIRKNGTLCHVEGNKIAHKGLSLIVNIL
jgi:hypothetical protein